MNALHRNRHTKGGVTLVELMVVVTILLLLAAFAIPTIRPLTQGRRLREAARAIDVLLTQAKTRAIVNQLPVGVLLERMEQVDAAGVVYYQDDACNVLRLVEIPPPYAGDFTDSRVRIQNWTTVALSGGNREGHPQFNPSWPAVTNYIVLKLAIQPLSLSNGLLRRGDQVQFGFQGPYFTIVNDTLDDSPTSEGMDFKLDDDGYIVFDDSDPNYAADLDGDGFVDTRILTVAASADELGGVSWPLTDKTRVDFANPRDRLVAGLPVWSGDTTFQFFRQPEPSPIAPLRLPKDTVIDLGDSGYFPNPASGADAFGFVYTPLSTPHVPGEHRGPMILFAPSGAISSVYHWDAAGNYGPASVMEPIFLMIGKWERTGLNTDGTSLAEDGLHNWQDASNIWISIGPQSGLATAAGVNAAQYLHDNGTPADPSDDYLADNVISPTGVWIPPTIFDSRRSAREAQISKGANQE